jgi:hypothetical protein
MYKEKKKIGLYKKKKVGSCDVHTRSNAFDNAREGCGCSNKKMPRVANRSSEEKERLG